MIAIILCVLALISCYVAGRRSIGLGLVALMVFGYFYGILRANLLTTYSHFIFDAGMIGLFLSPSWRTKNPLEQRRTWAMKLWTILLLLWPMMLVALPFQPILISLVGLRGNTFFFPFLIIGSRLKHKDLTQFSIGLAVLNLVAVAFAGAEYFLGLMRFFPLSPVTLIMYSSRDAGGGFYRLPATFTSAHAFGGTMVWTIPFLVGLWTRTENARVKMLAVAGMSVAMLGILMSATRVNFIYGSAMILFVIFTAKMRGKQKAVFLAVIVLMGVVAMSNTRFQRFKSLGDTEGVTERIAGSVNLNFWEIFSQYPMGNGLGGGGTSMPYFLEGQVRNPIGMENEYARILSEQGILGLALWVTFVIWFFMHAKYAFAKGAWTTGRRLAWCMACASLGTAFIGTGMLTSIPGTVFLVLAMGWTSVPEAAEPRTAPAPLRVQQTRVRYAPAMR
jgi:hypothetical protein